MRYFIKISWPDKEQPLLRCHENHVVEIEVDLWCLQGDEIVREVKNKLDTQVWYITYADRDISIDFMVKL